MLRINQEIEALFLGYTVSQFATTDLEKSILHTIQNYIDNRFLSSQDYLDFIIFSCDIGRLDIVYYALFFVDKNSSLLKKFVVQQPELRRIYQFSNDQSIFHLQKLALFFNQNEVAYHHLKEQFLSTFEKLNQQQLKHNFANRKENMILSFMFFLVLKNYDDPFSAKQLSDIVLYFKRANTEQIRKDHCYFYAVHTALKYRMHEFFKLPGKSFFNHLTYILHSFSTTKLLLHDAKISLQRIFVDNVHQNNSFRTQKKPKFAICISGMYRNHCESLVSIQENLISYFDADVFIHSWDQMNYWGGYGGNPYCLRVFGQDFLSLIPLKYHSNLRLLAEKFPLVTAILEAPLSIENDIALFEEILQPKTILVDNEEDFMASLGDISGYTRFRSNCNQIKMFYGIKQSFDLALSHDDYDYIIRVRPDAVYSDIQESLEVFSEKLENNTLYAHAKYGIGINDLFFYMSASVAQEFSSFVGGMLKTNMLSPYDDFPIIDSHALLNTWLFANNYVLSDIGDVCQLLINPRISLPGLKNAIVQDREKLSQEDRLLFNDFIQALQDNYG